MVDSIAFILTLVHIQTLSSILFLPATDGKGRVRDPIDTLEWIRCSISILGGGTESDDLWRVLIYTTTNFLVLDRGDNNMPLFVQGMFDKETSDSVSFRMIGLGLGL